MEGRADGATTPTQAPPSPEIPPAHAAPQVGGGDGGGNSGGRHTPPAYTWATGFSERPPSSSKRITITCASKARMLFDALYHTWPTGRLPRDGGHAEVDAFKSYFGVKHKALARQLLEYKKEKQVGGGGGGVRVSVGSDGVPNETELRDDVEERAGEGDQILDAAIEELTKTPLCDPTFAATNGLGADLVRDLAEATTTRALLLSRIQSYTDLVVSTVSKTSRLKDAARSEQQMALERRDKLNAFIQTCVSKAEVIGTTSYNHRQNTDLSLNHSLKHGPITKSLALYPVYTLQVTSMLDDPPGTGAVNWRRFLTHLEPLLWKHFVAALRAGEQLKLSVPVIEAVDMDDIHTHVLYYICGWVMVKVKRARLTAGADSTGQLFTTWAAENMLESNTAAAAAGLPMTIMDEREVSGRRLEYASGAVLKYLSAVEQAYVALLTTSNFVLFGGDLMLTVHQTIMDDPSIQRLLRDTMTGALAGLATAAVPEADMEGGLDEDMKALHKFILETVLKMRGNDYMRTISSHLRAAMASSDRANSLRGSLAALSAEAARKRKTSGAAAQGQGAGVGGQPSGGGAAEEVGEGGGPEGEEDLDRLFEAFEEEADGDVDGDAAPEAEQRDGGSGEGSGLGALPSPSPSPSPSQSDPHTETATTTDTACASTSVTDASTIAAASSASTTDTIKVGTKFKDDNGDMWVVIQRGKHSSKLDGRDYWREDPAGPDLWVVPEKYQSKSLSSLAAMANNPKVRLLVKEVLEEDEFELIST